MVTNLGNIKVSKDEFLASCDAVSLFTIVSLTKAHENPKLNDRTKIRVKVVTELLYLVLHTTCFQYKGMRYQQKMELLREIPARL